jgi:hypothetical protein
MDREQTNPLTPVEETTMTTSRKTTVVLVIAAAAIAVATASFTARPAATQPSEDFGLRHPGGLGQPVADLSAYYRGSDYAERRAAAQLAAFNRGSDYALRHPELSRAAKAVDTSDYFLRHPD